MEESGKEGELAMFHLKPAAAFVNTAFAENEDLLTAPERVHHDGPFFEGCCHSVSVGKPTRYIRRVEERKKKIRAIGKSALHGKSGRPRLRIWGAVRNVREGRGRALWYGAKVADWCGGSDGGWSSLSSVGTPVEIGWRGVFRGWEKQSCGAVAGGEWRLLRWSGTGGGGGRSI